MKKSFQIAIDGPVAAGKGTVSRLLAERLGFLYVDTGAMYRVAALLSIREGIDPSNEDEVTSLLSSALIELSRPEGEDKDRRLITVLLNNEDVSWKIRIDEVGQVVPIVAQHPKVREILVKKQQEIAANQNVVMEGRDITSIVLPEADLKIYLTGSDEVRAERRHLEQQTSGVDITYEEVFADLQDRDNMDMKRSTDPLVKVEDAWEIDTSDLTVTQVVDLIEARVKSIMKAA